MKLPSITLPKFRKKSAEVTEGRAESTKSHKEKPAPEAPAPRRYAGVQVEGTRAFVKEGWFRWVFDGPSANAVAAAIHARFGENGLFACSQGYTRPDGSFFVTLWKHALRAAPKQMEQQRLADEREEQRRTAAAAAAKAKAAKRQAGKSDTEAQTPVSASE